MVGLDIREDKLKTLEAESKNKKGEFYGRIADISKKDDIIEAFRWTENNIGPVSVVVNNAGVNICLKVSDCEYKFILHSFLFTNISTTFKVISTHGKKWSIQIYTV